MRLSGRTFRRVRLSLDHLESREVPAGAVTAAVSSSGVLSVNGDDLANGVTLKVEAAQVTITPDATTSVNGAPAGTVIVLPNPAKSLKADLRGGNDNLAIDVASDFILTGGASIQLGDGSNVLGFSTTQKIDLGSLVVKAGDGDDSVSVAGGVGKGSQVTGSAKFELGAGDSATTLTELQFPGSSGLLVKDGQASATSTLTATNIKVVKGVTANIGGSTTNLIFTGDTLGGLTASGGILTSVLDSTTITGNVSLKGKFQANLSAIAGNVNVGIVSLDAGTTAALDSSTATFSAGNVTVKGKFVASLNGSSTTFAAGNVTIKGGLQATLSTGSGVFTANNITVQANTIAQFNATGTSAAVNGNLNVTSGALSQIQFTSSALSEVKGNLAMTGGWIGDAFTTNSKFKAFKNVTLNLGNGSNAVTFGDGTAAVAVLGTLTVKTGGGDDVIAIKNVEVTKATSITAGAGNDALAINLGSKFDNTFSADLGTGDDIISIAQSTGAPAPVTFVGKATIKAGAGNDILFLGLATGGPGGDANSMAVFTATLANKIDGGSGINAFDGLTPAQSPSQYTGLTATNFLNWTDPNP